MTFKEIDYNLELSPLLSTQWGDEAWFLRHFGPNYQLEFRKYSGLLLNYSVEEIEDYMISKANMYIDSLDMLPFSIRRQCAYVAQSCRRGFGNNVLMNSRLFSLITEPLGTDKPSLDIGRWKSEGKLRKFDQKGTIKIWTNDIVPDNIFVVFYNGLNKTDSAGSLLIDDLDNITLSYPQDNDLLFGHPEDYIRYVKVVPGDHTKLDTEAIVFGTARENK